MLITGLFFGLDSTTTGTEILSIRFQLQEAVALLFQKKKGLIIRLI